MFKEMFVNESTKVTHKVKDKDTRKVTEFTVEDGVFSTQASSKNRDQKGHNYKTVSLNYDVLMDAWKSGKSYAEGEWTVKIDKKYIYFTLSSDLNNEVWYTKMTADISKGAVNALEKKVIKAREKEATKGQPKAKKVKLPPIDFEAAVLAAGYTFDIYDMDDNGMASGIYGTKRSESVSDIMKNISAQGHITKKLDYIIAEIKGTNYDININKMGNATARKG